MRRFRLLVAILAAGCSSREPLEDPTIKRTPPSLIPEEGASLYVLEGPAGWLAEDLGFAGTTLDDSQLATALRHGISHRQIRFIGHADFQPTHGWPTEATLFNPDAEGHGPRIDQVGFKVALTARDITSEGCRVQWKAEQVRVYRPNPGATTKTEVIPIASDTTDLPFKRSMVISQAKEGGREYTLLLRLASLKQP